MAAQPTPRKPYDGKNGVKITKPAAEDLSKVLMQLVEVEVLVGFPEDGAARTDASEASGINNASLGYIHDHGAPEQNIPARPFMEPGIESVKERLETKMKQVGKVALSQKSSVDLVARGLTQVGLIAATGIKSYINAGIEPPLADSTLRARAARGRKGAKEELKRRKAGEAPTMAYAKPLVDTGQLRNAVTYVIRARKKRK